MTVAPRQRQAQTGGTMGQQLREGWTYVASFLPIRNILLLLALVSLVGMPYTVLMPAVATEMLGGGPTTLGLLMAAVGVGALTGAVVLAARKSVLGLGRVIPLAAGVFGVGLIAFSFSRLLWLSMACLVVTGLGFMVQMASSNTLLQTIVDEDKRGRVMSFYTMAVMGITPFGSLLAGSVAHAIGSAATLRLGGDRVYGRGPVVRPVVAGVTARASPPLCEDRNPPDTGALRGESSGPVVKSIVTVCYFFM